MPLFSPEISRSEAAKKMFGDVVMQNGMKHVRDTDGYLIYRVTYNGTEIRVNNIVKEYSIVIYSEKNFSKVK